MNIQYSVVIPLKNEEENVQDLLDELEPVMSSIQKPWEVLCIDDGSTDRTLEILRSIASKKPWLRILAFDKNYGQSSAFDAGFKAARGEYILTLDGDRQNDPQDIPRLVKEADSCDMVCGRRINRQDTWIKKITSYFANQIRSRVCHDGIQDTGCSLKLYKAESLRKIKMFQGMHRFLPALFLIEGLKIKEIPVSHRERVRGKTKYNFFNRSFNTIADMMAVRWMHKRRLTYRIESEMP
jgi:glycosyltransferase involved in cell wall biosynthesis